MIEQLHIHHFRNIEQANLKLAQCNLVVGKNGSGKTSLLEAIFLLSRGRSFRHHEPKRYICHHQQACVVWAKTSFDESTLAVKKQIDTTGKSDTLLKLNNLTIKTQSTLSLHLPTLLIDPSGMNILDEGSAMRRQMLDWLAFHVKQDFYHHWLQYQRLLKQRNCLLKQSGIRMRQAEVFAWDEQMARHAEFLHLFRQQIFELWQPCFLQIIQKLLPNYQNQLHLHYSAGFDINTPFQKILSSRLLQDIELGYTRIGAHRADISIVLKYINQQGKKIKEQATHILSRGEKKLLIVALKLSQLMLVCQLIEQGQCQVNPPLVLIDDIDAELDDDAIDILLDVILPLPCQLIVSSLHQSITQKIQQKLKDATSVVKFNSTNTSLTAYKMFYVEQGQFKELSEQPL